MVFGQLRALVAHLEHFDVVRDNEIRGFFDGSEVIVLLYQVSQLIVLVLFDFLLNVVVEVDFFIEVLDLHFVLLDERLRLLDLPILFFQDLDLLHQDFHVALVLFVLHLKQVQPF